MTDGAGRVADSTGNWVDGLAPAWTRPYLRLARLDRPIGSWLLLLPCWWSVGLAAVHAGTHVNLWHLLLFFIGAFAMRGAGCTWNDIVDRDLDAMVERTVLLQFNRFTVYVGLASLAVVAVYPFMKRITYWPQIMLGLAFSWGALMGWPATFGRLDLPALLLYAGAICWVIGYDTIYAHQDREDDAVALSALAGWSAGAGIVFSLGLLAFAAHLSWQIRRLDIDDPVNCLAVFKSNRDAGLILFAGLVLDAAARQLH